MRDPCPRERRHLLLRRAHEQEAASIEQEGREVLEAVDLGVDIAAFRPYQSVLVFQHERDLDYARQAGRHEGVAKSGVDVSGNHEALRVAAHGPTGHEDDETGDEVAPWAPSAVP